MTQIASHLDGEIRGLGRLGEALAALGDAALAPVGWLAAVSIHVVFWRLRARINAVVRRLQTENLIGRLDPDSLGGLLHTLEDVQRKLQAAFKQLSAEKQTIGVRILERDFRLLFDAFEKIRVHLLEYEAQLDISAGRVHRADSLEEMLADLDR